MEEREKGGDRVGRGERDQEGREGKSEKGNLQGSEMMKGQSRVVGTPAASVPTQDPGSRPLLSGLKDGDEHTHTNTRHYFRDHKRQKARSENSA